MESGHILHEALFKTVKAAFYDCLSLSSIDSSTEKYYFKHWKSPAKICYFKGAHIDWFLFDPMLQAYCEN